MRTTGLKAASLILLAAGAAGAAERRPITLADMAGLKSVADPQVDPSGQWVAYTVGEVDEKADKNLTHIWMTRWDGSGSIQLTARPDESESTPRWSPDGRYLAFLSSRTDEKKRDQLWLLDRNGGEAKRPVELDGSVMEYAWSPDGKKIALILLDPDRDEATRRAAAAAAAATPVATKPGDPQTPGSAPDEPKEVAKNDKEDEERPLPIVIDRYRFKRDYDGYLRTQRRRLVLLDLATGKTRRLTKGDFDEHLPSWSPDGGRIAFVSNRDSDPDRSANYDLFAVSSSAAAVNPTRLTSFAGSDNDPDWSTAPAWSPDGKSIAYLQGPTPRLLWYGVRNLAIIPASGGAPKLLTALDRNIYDPTWSLDGRSLSFIVEDDGAQWVGRVAAAGGPVETVSKGQRVVQELDQGKMGATVALVTDFTTPSEVYALEGATLRPLSRQNQAWLARLQLASAQATSFKSADGTEVHGFIVRPASAGKRAGPALLDIHGGPASQYDWSFAFDWQLFAANGYTIVAANPRGSTGRGEAYSAAIYADWGNVDVKDVLAAVDDAVARKLADPDRLGVGGWSYGGMLTNYTIASDTRFKAAVSGASISNIFAGYGTDQYIYDYEVELGRPWEKPDVWMRISYPFFHADRIKTPTLFMVGQLDVNVPTLATEQMYQALRSQGVDTQMVVYPGEYHGISRPSFLVDRLKRNLDWYGARLK